MSVGITVYRVLILDFVVREERRIDHAKHTTHGGEYARPGNV